MFKGSTINYSVSREGFDYDTQKYNVIVARCMDITIKANSEEECYNLLTSLCEYMGVSESTCACCEEIKEGLFELTECITIEDREQYNELKDLYKEWKKQAKNVTVPVVKSTTEVEPTKETNQTIVTEVVEPITTETKNTVTTVTSVNNNIQEQQSAETSVTPTNNSIDFDSIGKKVKTTYKAPCDTVTVVGTIYDVSYSKDTIYIEGVNQYGVEDIWEYNINNKNLILEILKE